MISPSRLILDILELARWAPSGDNDQPWRFRIVSDTSFDIVVPKVRIDLYSRNAWPIYLAVGCLVETVQLAASVHGQTAAFGYEFSQNDESFQIKVMLSPSSATPEPIAAFIKERSVNRFCYSVRSINSEHEDLLQASVGQNVELIWGTSLSYRWKIIKVSVQNTLIRLTIPETYPIHIRMLKWRQKFSERGIPDAALGADKLTLRLAEWGFKSLKRVLFFNRYMGGTFVSNMEMDVLPNLFCGAQVYIWSAIPLVSPVDFIEYGRKVQRFWLTATSLGIQHQPNIATIAFAEFARENDRFTEYAPALKRAKKIAQMLDPVFMKSPKHVAWMGRIGYAAPAQARSTRLPLEQLILEN